MEPASIRYKNPGAMWGGNPISKKWGEQGNVMLKDGMGQGNRIAVFPDYVHGICAQIDLWRELRYRNKKFKDAIAVWSGGNWVASYIKFVKDRVPGMTEDTIMNDALLSSPMGIQFLKAQAWHEAGKRYPAPDEDWIEAQRMVFGVTTAPTTETPSAVAPERDTKWLQVSLNKLGASPPLVEDGLVGPALRTAVAEFQRKNGLDDDGLVGPATMREVLLDLADIPPEIKLPTPGTPPPAELADTFWGRFMDLFKAKGT